ncbi:hypothetical protein GGX14DRAFT_392325 [Mycena pura]|uniref:Uncharacterized protein n=1 Tax=Mycena pura TaxID=153505 RepID=A0AAD6YEG3_9AGAR|nr:hypothetical protein GGX14DRAFT_392325 [Mycena pura]
MAPLKQRRHMQRMRDARGAPKNAGKENEPNFQPSLSLKSRAIQDLKRRADAAEISEKKIIRENEQLKREQKKAARREKRHRQKINNLKQRVKEAEDEFQKATAHGEAQVRKILKRRAEDENGWWRRLANAGRRLSEAEQHRARTTEELKTKLGALAHLRAVFSSCLTTGTPSNCIPKISTRAEQKRRGRAYKVELRAIARVLVSSGCKEGKVGDLMQDIARIFGVDLDRAMSRRTVRRAVLEGLVASQVQLGVEMKYSEDITMSSDSTSRRKLNYQSHHIHMRVPVKNTDGSVSVSTDPKIRFLGIASTVDHTAWLTIYNDIISTYNASPLGRRLGTLDLRMICRMLRGMCGDHANNEKALSEECYSWCYPAYCRAEAPPTPAAHCASHQFYGFTGFAVRQVADPFGRALKQPPSRHDAIIECIAAQARPHLKIIQSREQFSVSPGLGMCPRRPKPATLLGGVRAGTGAHPKSKPSLVKFKNQRSTVELHYDRAVTQGHPMSAREHKAISKPTQKMSWAKCRRGSADVQNGVRLCIMAEDANVFQPWAQDQSRTGIVEVQLVLREWLIARLTSAQPWYNPDFEGLQSWGTTLLFQGSAAPGVNNLLASNAVLLVLEALGLFGCNTISVIHVQVKITHT